MKNIFQILLICVVGLFILTACSSDSEISSSHSSSSTTSSYSHDDDIDWEGAMEAYVVGKARYDAMTEQE